MNELLFSIFATMGSYGCEPEYLNLDKEEKANVDYMNECLFSENKHISDAAFYTMLLILEISQDSEKYEPEAVHARLEEIQKDLTCEELEIMTKFVPACIGSMGIYNEESKRQRKLRKGDNLNDKSK